MGATRRLRRKAGALVAVGATALMSAGCWPQVGGGPGNANHNPTERVLTAANVASLSEIWSVEGKLDVVVGDQVVGAESGDGFVDAVSRDAATGAEQWRHSLVNGTPVAGTSVGHPVVVLDDRQPRDELWVGWSADLPDSAPWASITSRLFLDTGDWVAHFRDQRRAVWLVPFRGGVVGQFDMADASTGIPTPYPSFIVVDSATGSSLWGGAAGSPDVPPIVVDDVILSPLASTVRAYPAAGCGSSSCEPAWVVDVGGEVRHLGGDPTDGVFAVGTGTAGNPGDSGDAGESGESGESGDPGELVAIDRHAHGVGWRSRLPGGPGPLAIAEHTVYVASGDQLLAFDADGCGAPSCTPSWTASIGEASGGPVVAGGVVYVPTTDGRILAFDPDGRQLAQVTVDSPASSLVVSGGRLFAQAGAQLTAFAPV